MQREKDYLLHLRLSPRQLLEDTIEITFQRRGMYVNTRKPEEKKNEELEKNEGS